MKVQQQHLTQISLHAERPLTNPSGTAHPEKAVTLGQIAYVNGHERHCVRVL